MNLFRVVLIVVWAILAFITWRAITLLGSDGSYILISDFSQPWRAQYYSDFIIHVLLIAGWVLWREPSKIVGLLCALACIAGGSLFSLLYLFVTSYRAGGDARVLLLGKHLSR
ncbi:MAG TPA: hypothetical protein VLC91_03290 [Spongiibacteraceae bacterium]|nr:hypothetical protein [Spongiibacteraceae bacterium]